MPRKDPDRHQTRTSFKEPAPRGSGNYPNPTHTQPVNPKTRAPQHTFGGLAECLPECLSECALEIPICAGKRLSEPANTYLSGKYLPEPVNTYPR